MAFWKEQSGSGLQGGWQGWESSSEKVKIRTRASRNSEVKVEGMAGGNARSFAVQSA